jgi:hypothetical protein
MIEEYEDLVLEFDITPEELERINESLNFSNIRYVYFDKITGDIISTTDQKTLDTETSYFETTSEDLVKSIPADEHVANFKVVTDLNNKFEIVPKVIKLNAMSSMLVLVPYSESPATVTIFNDIEHKNWVVVLNEEERIRLQNSVANYTKPVFVTAKENKNILYRVFDVNLNTLITSGSVTIPHEMIVESITSKLRLSTIKFFDSYALKEKYEPKV